MIWGKSRVSKPTFRELIPRVRHVFTAKYSQLQNLLWRQLRLELRMEIATNWRGARIAVTFLHFVIHDDDTFAHDELIVLLLPYNRPPMRAVQGLLGADTHPCNSECRNQDRQPSEEMLAHSAAQGVTTEVLAGLVERVTFHNAENGFCVLRVKARGQRDLITVLGHAATIAAGEFVQLSGNWVNDRTHGLQFRAGFLKASPPTTIEGIERYLGSGTIRGIGPIYARLLGRAFGEAVCDMIEQQPGAAARVPGIGPKRAPQIIAG